MQHALFCLLAVFCLLTQDQTVQMLLLAPVDQCVRLCRGPTIWGTCPSSLLTSVRLRLISRRRLSKPGALCVTGSTNPKTGCSPPRTGEAPRWIRGAERAATRKE